MADFFDGWWNGGTTAGSTAGSWGSTANVLGVGGAVMSTVGSYYNAKAQQNALEYQSIVAETNARLAEKAAQSTLLQGQQEENKVQLRTAALKGTQRASLAANGIDLGEGSAAQIQASTDMMGKIDADTVAANALRTAWGYRQQGTNYSNQALMDKASASAISPFGSAMGTLMTSASRVAGGWYSQSKAGIGADESGSQFSRTGADVRARR